MNSVAIVAWIVGVNDAAAIFNLRPLHSNILGSHDTEALRARFRPIPVG